MWLIFLYLILLGVSAGVISLIIRCLNVVGNDSGYPGLEDVTSFEYEKS
jgi:hypothetical protein